MTRTANPELRRTMKVVIIYGSAGDQAFMQPGRDYLDKEQVAHEERVLSAHRILKLAM